MGAAQFRITLIFGMGDSAKSAVRRLKAATKPWLVFDSIHLQ
jgi:hypothetical protein